MSAAFSETLSGGVQPRAPGLGVQPVTLDLTATARGVVACALGAPLAIRGQLRAQPATTPQAAFLPRSATLTGTLRFLISSGLFYDLRISPDEGAAPCDQLELRGARRFLRGDLFASATTFDGVLLARGAELAEVRLRFDARDDVPRLLRSVRLAS